MVHTMPVTVATQVAPGEREGIALSLMSRQAPWFPDVPTRRRYARAAATLPMAAWREGGTIVGFLSLARPTVYTGEIFLLAVVPGWQRRGIGRMLVHWAEVEARAAGAEFLIVKTLGPSTPNQNYLETRRFYSAVGFRALAEFHNWGPDNTCLLLAKSLAQRPAGHSA